MPVLRPWCPFALNYSTCTVGVQRTLFSSYCINEDVVQRKKSTINNTYILGALVGIMPTLIIKRANIL